MRSKLLPRFHLRFNPVVFLDEVASVGAAFRQMTLAKKTSLAEAPNPVLPVLDSSNLDRVQHWLPTGFPKLASNQRVEFPIIAFSLPEYFTTEPNGCATRQRCAPLSPQGLTRDHESALLARMGLSLDRTRSHTSNECPVASSTLVVSNMFLFGNAFLRWNY